MQEPSDGIKTKIYRFPSPNGYVTNVFKDGIILECNYFGLHPRQIDPCSIIGYPIERLFEFIDGAERIIDASNRAAEKGIPSNDRYIIEGIPRTGCCFPQNDGSVLHIGYAFPRN